MPATVSFPSGHITAAVAFYGGLPLIVDSLARSLRVRRFAVAAAAAVAVAVGLARLCHGLHHLTDVEAGAALGVACLAVALIAARCMCPEREQ